MNCKPGDLAIVCRAKTNLNVGRILTCLRLATQDEVAAQVPLRLSEPVWITDRPLLVMNTETGQTREMFMAPDDMLRPIRDPGDDAVDEVLLLVSLCAGQPQGEAACAD